MCMCRCWRRVRGVVELGRIKVNKSAKRTSEASTTPQPPCTYNTTIAEISLISSSDTIMNPNSPCVPNPGRLWSVTCQPTWRRDVNNLAVHDLNSHGETGYALSALTHYPPLFVWQLLFYAMPREWTWILVVRTRLGAGEEAGKLLQREIEV